MSCLLPAGIAGASPLLSDPLTQRRLNVLAGWLDTSLFMPLATYSVHNDSGGCCCYQAGAQEVRCSRPVACSVGNGARLSEAWLFPAQEPCTHLHSPGCCILCCAGGQELTCRAAMTMLQLAVGILLPALLSAIWVQQRDGEDEEQQQRRRRHVRWAPERVAAALHWLWERVNTAVHETFAGAEVPSIHRTVLAWMLLAHCWLAAKVLVA